MKKYFKCSGYAKRQSADIRRQDESAGTDNQRIVKHRGRKIFVCPGAQDTLATPLQHVLLDFYEDSDESSDAASKQLINKREAHGLSLSEVSSYFADNASVNYGKHISDMA